MNEPPQEVTKLPCRSCGKLIMPFTAETNRGCCIPCVGKEFVATSRFFRVEHIANASPSRPTEPKANEDVEKLPCLYCGRSILPTTALSTGGYCIPHSRPAFVHALGGTPEFSEPYSQSEVWDELVGQNFQQPLGLLFSIMAEGDCLKFFHVEPNQYSPWVAKRGVACFRGGKALTGFVIAWEENPAFYAISGNCTLTFAFDAFDTLGKYWSKIKGYGRKVLVSTGLTSPAS